MRKTKRTKRTKRTRKVVERVQYTKKPTKKEVAKVAADEKKVIALKAAGLNANASVADVVREFKRTVGEVNKTLQSGMRRAAELAALLVEGYGLTQEQAAEKLGYSQPWVSNILRWRRDGYKNVAFGPETHKPKLLPGNKPEPPEPKEPESTSEPPRVTGNGSDVEQIAKRDKQNEQIAIDDIESAVEKGELSKEDGAKQIEAIRLHKPEPVPGEEPPGKIIEGPSGLGADGDAILYPDEKPEEDPQAQIEFWAAKLSVPQAIMALCDVLLKNDATTPYEMFKQVSEILLPRMNMPTRVEARKLVTAVTNKADQKDRQREAA